MLHQRDSKDLRDVCPLGFGYNIKGWLAQLTPWAHTAETWMEALLMMEAVEVLFPASAKSQLTPKGREYYYQSECAWWQSSRHEDYSAVAQNDFEQETLSGAGRGYGQGRMH